MMTALAWFVGVLCGIAYTRSLRYRVAMTSYFVLVMGMHFAGITAADLWLDFIVSTGFLLLCVGIALGITGAIIKPTEQPK